MYLNYTKSCLLQKFPSNLLYVHCVQITMLVLSLVLTPFFVKKGQIENLLAQGKMSEGLYNYKVGVFFLRDFLLWTLVIIHLRLTIVVSRTMFCMLDYLILRIKYLIC